MKHGHAFRSLVTAILFTMSACNIGNPAATMTPTVEQEEIATARPPLIATAKALPSATVTRMPTLEIATATATDTAAPSTPTRIATATSAFFEYVVQEDDTLFYIIQLPRHGFGYDLEVAATVVALNENISHIDLLPPVGNTIFIPRPTSTATAVGASATEAILATIGVNQDRGALLQSGSSVGCYEVESGDSIVAIAEQYSTTLEVLSQLNKEIQFFGCAFTEPSGGPDCRPNIQIGQCVFVPLPTPLPSKTPTPTGDETATPTATFLPPRLIFPADGALVRTSELRLQWVGINGINDADEYLVELIDQTANWSLPLVSISNDLIVPSGYAPADGESHIMQWRVSVARGDDQGVYTIVGAPGIWRSFEWTSR
ncbi:MAG: LysM peptidoglycan-binding domain-containing protein [Chloroflexi bacterium]|nr:LysM peptidoglycan-binding domain-containing protein [Chloroflexota bacterium]